MVRRFAPCHPCCTAETCTGCCQGAYPTEYDVDFTLTDDTCSNCGSWDGTYTLTKNSGACSWSYDSGYTLTETCSGSHPVVRITVGLVICCFDALLTGCTNGAGTAQTTYDMQLSVKIYREQDCYDICPPFGSLTNNWIDTHLWRKSGVSIASWTCNGASNYEIPWYSRSTRRDSKTACIFSPGNYSCTTPTITTNFLCQSNTASAYITAVP